MGSDGSIECRRGLVCGLMSLRALFVERENVSTTRLIRSGNGQAVRIPAELAYADTNVELTITRHGDVITIFPNRQDLKAAVQTLRSMPKPSSVERCEPIEMPDRG